MHKQVFSCYTCKLLLKIKYNKYEFLFNYFYDTCMHRTNGMFKNFQMVCVSEKRKYVKIEQTLSGLLSKEWIYNNYFKWLKRAWNHFAIIENFTLFFPSFCRFPEKFLSVLTSKHKKRSRVWIMWVHVSLFYRIIYVCACFLLQAKWF